MFLQYNIKCQGDLKLFTISNTVDEWICALLYKITRQEWTHLRVYYINLTTSKYKNDISTHCFQFYDNVAHVEIGRNRSKQVLSIFDLVEED